MNVVFAIIVTGFALIGLGWVLQWAAYAVVDFIEDRRQLRLDIADLKESRQAHVDMIARAMPKWEFETWKIEKFKDLETRHTALFNKDRDFRGDFVKLETEINFHVETLVRRVTKLENFEKESKFNMGLLRGKLENRRSK